MCEFLEKLGFDGLFDVQKEIPVAILQARLAVILAEYDTEDKIKHVCYLLGKQVNKVKALVKIKVGDKLFVKQMLAFINGSLTETFGVSIKRTDCRAKVDIRYRLENTKFEDGTFYHERLENLRLYADDTPLIGFDRRFDQGQVIDLDIDDDEPQDQPTTEDKLEFLRALKALG